MMSLLLDHVTLRKRLMSIMSNMSIMSFMIHSDSKASSQIKLI